MELFSLTSGSPSGNEVGCGSCVKNDGPLSVISVGYSNGYSNTYEKSRLVSSEINGSNVAREAIENPRTLPSVNQTIGFRKSYDTENGDPFYGYIGEIIIFDRYLNPEERSAVTKYLGQKWKVNISSNS